MKTNLLYHVALIDSPMLDENLQYLARYWSVFTHRRIVNLAMQPDWLCVKDFMGRWQKAGLPLDGVEFVESKNDPAHWESLSFVNTLLPRIKSLDKDECTFYAHAKGVSRSPSAAIRSWINFVYEHNLGDMVNVRKVMRRYAVAGVLKISQPFTAIKMSWHFPGSFFWFNHARLFSRDWRDIERDRYGIEAYPARHFKSREAYCLACPLTYPYLDLYDESTWEKIQRGGGKLHPTRFHAMASALLNRHRLRQ